ncbi:MAG: rhomboid family intramembrane serine protease [Pseudomonadota bacterium]
MQRLNRQDTFPPVIFGLLISCAVVFVLLQSTSLGRYGGYFALWTFEPNFRFWQPVTYSFLHGSVTHLAFNMFSLWMFGRELEYRWGSRRFLVFYLVSVLGGAAGQFALSVATGGIAAPMIGASGGVFGVLLAYGMTYPERELMLMFPPIPMKAKYMVIVFGVMELYLGASGIRTGIAHFAHLGGMVAGLGMMLYWRSQTPRRRF